MTTRTCRRTWLTTLFGIGSLLLAAELLRSVTAPRRSVAARPRSRLRDDGADRRRAGGDVRVRRRDLRARPARGALHAPRRQPLWPPRRGGRLGRRARRHRRPAGRLPRQAWLPDPRLGLGRHRRLADSRTTRPPRSGSRRSPNRTPRGPATRARWASSASLSSPNGTFRRRRPSTTRAGRTSCPIRRARAMRARAAASSTTRPRPRLPRLRRRPSPREPGRLDGAPEGRRWTPRRRPRPPRGRGLASGPNTARR